MLTKWRLLRLEGQGVGEYPTEGRAYGRSEIKHDAGTGPSNLTGMKCFCSKHKNNLP